MSKIEDVYIKIGHRIEWLRINNEFSQEELASKLSPPQTRASISNMETGRQRIPIHVLDNIAQICGTSLWKLLK